jgi:glycosyltransferase involved in cell wall biosynthesis
MKILYYYGRLNIGGAERSSVRLVNAFVQQGHQVDLVLKWQGGALEKELDPRVRIIAFKRANRFTDKYSGERWNGIPIMPPDVFIARLYQIARFFFVKLYLSARRPRYDLALIGYHGLDPSTVLQTCRSKVNAMIMRHEASVTDHERKSARFLSDPSKELDAYICVSQYVKDAMIDNYPAYKEKAFCIYNILPEINGAQKLEIPDAYQGHGGKLKILTLCRIDAEHKGIFRMVEACKELVKQNQDFLWFVVGDGKDKPSVSKKIIEAGLEKKMIMLSSVQDPFPYYQHADLVAVLSVHEGLCGVVNEAKIMKAPLIATRFSAIDEQITHSVNGYIVDNNLQAIIEGMSILLTDHGLRRSLSRNDLPEALLDNAAKIDQFDALTKKLSEEKRSNQSE